MSNEAGRKLRSALEANDPPQVAKALELAKGELASGCRDSDTLLWVGVALAQGGNYSEAKPVLEEALEADSPSFFALYWLSIVATKTGQFGPSAGYAARAVEIEPENPGALERLGLAYLDVFRFVDAESVFRAAIQLSSKPALLGGLGLALKGQRRTSEACIAFRKLLESDPNSFITHLNLAGCLLDCREGEAAVTHAQIAIKLRPSSVDAKMALANALVVNDQAEEAEACLRTIGQPGEQNAAILALSGRIKEILGKADEAVADYRSSLELNPQEPQAILGLVQSRRMADSDLPFIERVEMAAADQELPVRSQSSLHFALGKAYDDLACYERAMLNFDLANRSEKTAKFGDTPFSSNAVSKTNTAIIELFNREFLEAYRREGFGTQIPILVIGMIRSGTTLTEQILSCHPEVGSAGEQNFWLSNRSNAFRHGQPTLEPGKLREVAKAYCDLLATKAPGHRLVVDKLPNNYSVQPLIHLALPNARFIHIRRHPVDTCISIYATPNSARNEWLHDRDNIVFEYREYLRTMDAWRKVVPAEFTLEIDYEDLVTNQEEVTRRMIAFCGLEWNDACLRPQEWHGNVSTPSVLQVRQPVYRTSVERWRRYGPWLGAFRELLTQEEAQSIVS